MTTLTAIALLCLQPALGEPVVDTCANLEKNHFYDGDGKLVFTQFIAWQDALPYPNVVKDWRMYDKIAPEVVRDGLGWKMYFIDHIDGDLVMRELRAPSFQETHTQFDPEVLDRDTIPTCARTGLGRVRVR